MIRKTFNMLMLFAACSTSVLAAEIDARTGDESLPGQPEQALGQSKNKEESIAQNLERMRQQNPLAYRRLQRMYGANVDGTLKIPSNPENSTVPIDAGSKEGSIGK